MPAAGALPPFDPPAEERSIEAFDLAEMRKSAPRPTFSAITKDCDATAERPTEIVVCAPDPEKQRLRPLPEGYSSSEGLPKAEWGLGGGATVDVHLDSEQMPGGGVSNRVMAGVKLKF